MAGVAHYPCNYLGEEKRSQPVSNGKVMVKKKRKKTKHSLYEEIDG